MIEEQKDKKYDSLGIYHKMIEFWKKSNSPDKDAMIAMFSESINEIEEKKKKQSDYLESLR